MHTNTPILVGCGQVLQRDVDPHQALDPLGLMRVAAERAAKDAGANLLAQLDTIAVVNVIGWSYANAPRLLAEQLGAHPQREIYTTVGGNTPQWLVNRFADQIAAGTIRTALIAGAEAIDTLINARKAGVPLQWTKAGEGTPELLGSSQVGSSNSEMQHGMLMPTAVYPMFENALRVHYGLSIEAHRRRLGELCSAMSAVAARNPNAWFQTERSAETIATAGPGNRMVGFPYPKYMNAIMNVDQGAALLMTSVGAARELGIPESRWVYILGAAEAQDVWFPSERVNFHSSPAIRRIGTEALTMAGLQIGDVDLFDLYSCFPCAVQIARDMLGIGIDDKRSLTMTGGLPYHGGPGNNYTTHSIAEMMNRLREQPGKRGLVTGLGWYITKHALGIYSTEPPGRPWQRAEIDRWQDELDAMPHPRVVDKAIGGGAIETYTVLHDRDGQPTRGIVIVCLDNGDRVIANTPAEPALLDSLMQSEAIGRRGVVGQSEGLNTFRLSS